MAFVGVGFQAGRPGRAASAPEKKYRGSRARLGSKTFAEADAAASRKSGGGGRCFAADGFAAAGGWIILARKKAHGRGNQDDSH
jgi:hypothetical protein